VERGLAERIEKRTFEITAEGEAKGLAKGREQGISEERQRVARKLLAAGIPVGQIQEIAGLSKDDIVLPGVNPAPREACFSSEIQGGASGRAPVGAAIWAAAAFRYVIHPELMTDISHILSYLPRPKIEELEKVTRRIVDTGKAEIVVLFGSYARGKYKEKQGATQGKKSDYDILVVTAGVSEAALLEGLQGKFDDIDVHVQLVAEDIEFVNRKLKEGQFFFSDIKREGKILYTSGRYTLADPENLSPTRRREIAEEDFESWFKKASEFFIGYQDARQRNYAGKAAFELQQAVEMCYKATLMVFTHYIPHEHYLGILLERSAKLDRRMNEALPRDTKEQLELFNHLDCAYIGGRYRSAEEYPVTRDQLDYWARETRKLLDITETLCLERIEHLREIEQG
jgi:uncharacterized protein